MTLRDRARRASIMSTLLAALAGAATAPAGAQTTAPAAPPGTAAARPPASALAAVAPADSGPALAFADFARQVLATHPVARQARLGADQARADVLIARGAFDPTLTATLDQKTYNGSQYYNYATAEAKLPIPYVGSDVKLSYERAVGQRIAADRYTPRNGIFKLGFGVPLGQRVFTDERRAALTQARALAEVAEGERQGALNKLLFSAAKDYAAWYQADRVRGIAREGVELAEFRLGAVRARVQRGEAAPIDTVEARLEVQRRTVARYEADQAYYAAALDVSNYLWDDRAQPLELAAGARPTARGLEVAPVDSAQLPGWLRAAAARHPEVVKAEAKVDQAAAGRALAQQAVIPFAELSLNSIAPQTNFPGLTQSSRFDRNYALGGTFKTPLFFMKERGKLAQSDQKLESQRLEEARVRRSVALDVRQAVNDLSTLVAVVDLQRLAVAQARQLLRGETRRFEQGESSLLYVNIRERYVLEAEQKLAELEAKYVGTRAGLAVAIGDPTSVAGLGAGR